MPAFKSQKDLLIPPVDSEAYTKVMEIFELQKTLWHANDRSLSSMAHLAVDEAEVTEQKKFWMIQPHGYFKIIWDIFVSLVICYFSIFVILRLAFADIPAWTVILDCGLEVFVILDSTFIDCNILMIHRLYPISTQF